MGFQCEKRLAEKHKLLMPLKKSMPDKVYQKLNILQPIIMGGAIRSVFTNTEIKDYDLYSRNSISYDLLRTFFDGLTNVYKDTCKLLFETFNSTTYKIFGNIIQVVSLYQNNDIISKLSKFDFTVCQAAYDFNTDSFYYSDDFLVHNAQRRLVYTKSTDFPISTMIRVKKYLSKGYTISNTEYLKILLDVQDTKFETFADFKVHILGIDATFLMPFISLFEEKINNTIELNNMKYDKNIAVDFIEKFIELSKEHDLMIENGKEEKDSRTEMMKSYAMSVLSKNAFLN